MYTRSSVSSDEPVKDAVAEPAWDWGWTRNAEIWNGRMAMIGFFTVLFAVLASS